MSDFTLVLGDCREAMAGMAASSVHCCVTSPPYFGLRDYGVAGQLGLEKTPEEYIATMVEVFREVRRVLRDDGTLWLNIGDSYAGSWGAQSREPSAQRRHPDCVAAMCGTEDCGKDGPCFIDVPGISGGQIAAHPKTTRTGSLDKTPGCKAKDLIGIPWMLAFALRADGWYLRSDIIWHKPNPMPESVTDRPTKAHEYIFLLSKKARYYYDAAAIREPLAANTLRECSISRPVSKVPGIRSAKGADGSKMLTIDPNSGANKRSVWTVATRPYSGAHFATYPPALIEPCILAGTSERGCCRDCGAPWVRVTEKPDQVRRAADVGARERRDHDRPTGADLAKGPLILTLRWEPTCQCEAGSPVPCTVLDTFTGSGTTGEVAMKNGRNFVGIELNPEYLELARLRIGNTQPSLFGGAA